MPKLFWRDPSRVYALRDKMDTATNDMDRHRIHAHGMIDAALEDGEITPQEATQRKQDWDRRHGY